MGTIVKKMSVVQLTVLTAINMLGSGIVLLPSKLAQVGTISIFSWIVTALGSLALAYAFAKCGRFSRKPGGMGGYAEYAFGRSGNFMSNYTYGVSLLIANVAIAITAIGYATELFHVTLTPIGVAVATVVLLWLTTIANFGGPRITGQIGNVTIMGVIIPVLGVSVLGWFWFDSSLYVAAWNPHDMPIFHAVGASISITLWAFLGLESACANTDAVENPERNVPIAVLGGTIGAAVIYIASTNVIAGIVPNMDLAASTAPFGLAFATMFTPLIGNIVMGLMIIACIGSLLGWQFTIAQVFKSSADVGYFLKIFAKTTKSGTPIVGMLVLVVCQSALTLMTISPDLSKQFDMIVNLAVVTNLVPYLMSMAALMTIQKAAGVTPRKAMLTNGIAYIAAAYSYYALYSSGADAMMLGGIVTMLGWTLYGTVSRRFMTVDTPVVEAQWPQKV
ncbi:putrescine-ornithine antiporter [Pseudomonas arsenicoxydans]|uniref:Putrescine transporter PotE n=1 Tax=Pseudomonas arsenicoxydans TaxID=702115 RepID=A0A4P6G4X7_9PSED|nr:putrescine-ornithine antiporter [Pseudomonas arsenicoxydans]QAY86117.1 putrescine-ornithine antiporter [Pseudomonas arsenicoxydans]